MKTRKYDMKRDLYELTTMALSLEQYITTDQIFYTPLGQYSGMPVMTLGTFLIRLRRICVLQVNLDAGSRAQLGIAIQTHDKVLEDWAYHYKMKLDEELQSRLVSLNTFFDDLYESPQDSRDDFLPELLIRTAVEELVTQANDDINQTILDDIVNIDTRWRDVSHESYFHWDEQLREVYPQERYWWLYSELDLDTKLA